MANRLQEVLSGQEANYLLPFLWQRGEEEAVIRAEMARVFESGIRAVCVEARPHPDFLGPRWWRDMDVIMEEARARGMRVWMLDDDHFPTGHAAGALKDAPFELRRSFLRENHLDVLGPRPNASFLVKPFLMEFAQPAAAETRLVAVIAARRDAHTNVLTGETLDLTGAIRGDFLYWNVPAGCWRVFFVLSTPNGGNPGQSEYLNPIVPESTRVLLDTVYEPFFQRYPADFGHTFAGFFSDEPGFYNDNVNPYDYHSALGKNGLTLPWRPDMLALLSAEFGQDFRTQLPLLWHEGGAATAPARFAYMNLVSRLYGQHFTQQLGDWCREHGVEYIGHVIEDNGAHSHLGCSAGHFFRALWGQDMAGMDFVLWQLAPGCDHGTFTNVSGEGDGEFYHFGLAKMTASLAHIDPKKHNRAMCELFGAYGWVEGLKLMKWMTDHLLVRGINYFVPHAFSQAGFPDPDCPPHMYARGMNPQYRYYHVLNHYTNRVSHLLSGGTHVASVAVLYHAEAEWAGAAMPFYKPVKQLAQRQIDCDVLPIDAVSGAKVVDGMLALHEETYRALIIPSCQALPGTFLARLVELADAGLPIWFIDALPERAGDLSQGQVPGLLARLAAHPQVEIVPLAALAERVRARGWHEISAEGFVPDLRCYHTRAAEMDVYMFSNEHPDQAVTTALTLRHAPAPLLGYDALHNRPVALPTSQSGEAQSFPLHLGPYETLLVIAGEPARACNANLPLAATASAGAGLVLTGPWRLATATAQQYPAFSAPRELSALVDMAAPEGMPVFSGTFRYETAFDWPRDDASALLDLGEAYETAEVWLNEQPAGVRICPPYHFHLSGLHPGRNRLVIEVTNTLVRDQQDFLSRFTALDPSGLLGPVKITW